jgi:Zn-dependent M28 family amino/carboxypeptidase
MTPPTIAPETLQAHVTMLAGTIGEHNVFKNGTLARAADYIEQMWSAQGYAVTRYPYNPSEIGHEEVCNLEVTRLGTTKLNEIILVGAHYDSVDGSPGANDNASGVAAMLEISRVFAALTPRRTVRFVAFVNEEPPFFKTDKMGSHVYAKLAHQRGDDICAMIALETLGYYSDERGSQKYPSPLFKLLFPDCGNFIGFVSNLRSRSVMRRAVRAFRAHTDFPVECCAIPLGKAGADLSDHAQFWREGYPAFMVTDTAPYRYPHYHADTDTPDKVNYPALARVTQGLCGMVAALADEQP